MRICKVCSLSFSPKFNNQKCCSKKCMKINYNDYKKKLSIYLKNYYLLNREKIKIHHKIYNAINRENIYNKQKKYNEQHRREIREYKYNWLVEYRKKHKAEVKLKNRVYCRNKRKNNIIFRIKNNLRKRVWDAIKGVCKSESTIKLLGCSIEFLKGYLESQFKPGMSWDNYGKWEIDHIKPCAKFDLSKPSEQRKCFNYTNLQPLWMKDNRIKH